MLEGHVQRAGEEIEVHAQLIDPRTDTHAWADTYRRELTAENLFELQRDITRRITGALETRLTAGEEEQLGRRATGSLEAHRFYVRGRSLLEQREVPQMRRALDYFGQALAEDSRYALAHHEGRPTVQIMLHAALGHHERAFELIHEVYPRADNPWDVGFTVHLRHFFSPTLAPLRDDPRWDQFMAVMNTHWGLNPDGSLPDSLDVSIDPP